MLLSRGARLDAVVLIAIALPVFLPTMNLFPSTSAGNSSTATTTTAQGAPFTAPDNSITLCTMGMRSGIGIASCLGWAAFLSARDLAGPVILVAISPRTTTVGGTVGEQIRLIGMKSNGTVTFEYFSGNSCEGTATIASVVSIGRNYASQTFNTPGRYSWTAVYGADSNDNGTTSWCEPITVPAPAVTSTTTTTMETQTTTTTVSTIITSIMTRTQTVTTTATSPTVASTTATTTSPTVASTTTTTTSPTVASTTTTTSPTTSSTTSISTSTSPATTIPDPSFQNGTANIWYPPYSSTLVDYALGLINQDRQANGLPAVGLGSVPSGQQHADSMLYFGYFSHIDPQGYGPQQRDKLLGGTGFVSENIGLTYCTDSPPNSTWLTVQPCSPTTIENGIAVSEWAMMNNDLQCCSNGHRNNILDPRVSGVSIGIAYDSSSHIIYFVEDFELTLS